MRILVTGGAGYIGSHTCVELLQAGYDVCVFDNLSNSSRESIDRVSAIAGRPLEFHQGDLLDPSALKRVFSLSPVDGVIHFAGRKAVGESVADPLLYYRNNVEGSLNLTAAMREFDVKMIVFSSSATVYGLADAMPLTETSSLNPVNPYGRTKLMVEWILRDLAAADETWSVTALRYFNPAGAHPSGLIGEDPLDTPANLLPYVTQVAIGRRSHLSVFGDDYPTPDGTGIRDYIHVVDLARGHLAALTRMLEEPGFRTCNLGTGRGVSVLELVAAFEKASGKRVPYQVVDRRPGDVAVSYCDPSFSSRYLNWRAELDIDAICADAWRWQQGNPLGYRRIAEGKEPQPS